MTYWEGGAPLTVLCLCLLLGGAEVLRRRVPGLGRLGVPGSITAGVLGLLLGPGIAGWLPLERRVLEQIVYHGLALVFIAVALQPPARGGGRGAASIAFGVSTMITLQTLLGLTLVLLLGVFAAPAHPGLGLLLPLGFEQGPGQALSFGSAWEDPANWEDPAGALTDGTQIGLIVAALGFAWSVAVGVPLVLIGRLRGWTADRTGGERAAAEPPSGVAVPPPGALDRLTRQVVVVGICYLVTYGVVAGLSSLFPGASGEIYGLHFILGAGVAMGARMLLARTGGEDVLDEALLGRIAGLCVDVLTCAALAGIQLAVFRANWVPLVLVTTLGGIATLGWVLALAWRAFPEEPFEHAVVWFGMSTGTLPMGLALLRILDPDLRGPAATNAVIGSAGAVLGAAPLLLVAIPMAARGWPGAYPAVGWIAVAGLCGYLGVLLAGWRLVGPLKFSRPAAGGRGAG